MTATRAVRRAVLFLALAGLLVLLVACAPAAAPQPAAPSAPKPAAQPTAAAPAAQAAVELQAGSSYAKGDVYSNGLDKFVELVQQKSKGTLVIRPFYQSLGVEQQLAESVMAGSVDIGLMSNGNFGRFTNAYFVYDLPFIFRNTQAMVKSRVSPVGKQLDEMVQKDTGLKPLFTTSAGGGRDILTRNKPVKVPADISGLKMRTVSTPIDLATFKAWGTNPTPIDWAQTITALQQGVVDGWAAAPVFLLTSKTYEPTKYGIHIEYQQIFEEYFINAKKFASLSADHQKILLEAAREAEAWQNDFAVQEAAKAIPELAKLGLTISTPTPDEYNQWASIREKVWQEVGDQLKDKLDLKLAKQVYESQ